MDQSVISTLRRTIASSAALHHPQTTELEPNWIYTFRDRDEAVLYVGISRDPISRAYGHRASAIWSRFAVRATAFWVPGRDLGEVYERALIGELRPIFNVVHNDGSDEAVVAYCARYEAWDLVDHYLQHCGEAAEVLR